MADDPELQRFTRELLFSLAPSAPDRLEEVDGGLLIHDVPMLAAGVWTDSAKQTPLDYSPGVLQRHAANWLDNGMWSRHLGGVPRRITEKVGDIRLPRFMEAVPGPDGQAVENAVVADVFLHQLTQESRDTAAMVKAGLAPYVSVEHGGAERWNAGRQLYEIQDLFFTGAAIVNRGACAKCRINEPPQAANAAEGDDMDTTELEAKIAELEAKDAERVRQLETVQTENTELKRQLGEAEKRLGAVDGLETRLKALEDLPLVKAGGTEPRRELTAPPRYVIRNGEVSQE